MHPKSTKNSIENCALPPLARVSFRVKISRLFGTGSGLRVGCFGIGLSVFGIGLSGRGPGSLAVSRFGIGLSGRRPGSLAVSPVRVRALSCCWILSVPLSHCPRAVSSPWSTARQYPAGSRAVNTRWLTGRQSPSGSQAISPRLALRPSVPLRHTGRQYPRDHGPSVPHGAWPVSPATRGPSVPDSCAVVRACGFR